MSTKNTVAIELSKEQWGKLRLALQDAFPTYNAARIFVREQLDENLAAIAGETNLASVMYDLIQWAQAKGAGGNLVAAAQLVAPGHPKIQAIAAELLNQRIVVQTADAPAKALLGSGLERILRKDLKFEDAERWWLGVGSILPRVCQIKVSLGGGRYELGTGFLVGPDAVLTNHHVVAGAIGKSDGGERIQCIFDYKRDGRSNVLNQGVSYGLDEIDWLLDWSEPSPDAAAPEGQEPSGDQLDYALLRLSEKVAELPIGENKHAEGAPPRGYIAILDAPPPPDRDAPLYIVQHPMGDPLSLAIDPQAILWKSAVRVRYRTNTEGGSSGSPCFNVEWRPVALHHYGDPARKPEFNQGIPLNAIVARLRRRGKDTRLGR